MGEERRGDWERGVDENLASLNTGQRVTDKLIDDLELAVEEIDKSLRGDTEKGTSGLTGRTETLEHDLPRLENLYNKLHQDLYQDAAGNPGFFKRVEALENREKNKGFIWNFITNAVTQMTVIVVAIISLLGLLITNWDKIESYLNRKNTDPIDQAIDRAEHPKPRHRHYTIKEPSDNE